MFFKGWWMFFKGGVVFFLCGGLGWVGRAML